MKNVGNGLCAVPYEIKKGVIARRAQPDVAIRIPKMLPFRL